MRNRSNGRGRNTVLAAVAAAMLVAPLATPASAATVSGPLISGLVTPLGLAVGSDGTIYVSQTFAGTLTALDHKGARTLASVADGEIAGVDAQGKGTLVYTTSNAQETVAATFGNLVRLLPNGKSRVVADLLAFENAANPDQVNSYGFVGLTPECEATLPPGAELVPYTGILETHPYAVAIVPGGWVVADAAANDLVAVSANGRVRALTVFPALPSVVSAELAAEAGLDPCVVGATYRSEPVPTDVELGPDGMLYVSILAGGIAPGAVYRVDPRSGERTLLASGFIGATDLAVSPDGRIFVTELFADRVSEVVAGGPSPVASVPMPGAVEWANGRLYVTTGVFGDGQVVTVTP